MMEDHQDSLSHLDLQVYYENVDVGNHSHQDSHGHLHHDLGDDDRKGQLDRIHQYEPSSIMYGPFGLIAESPRGTTSGFYRNAKRFIWLLVMKNNSVNNRNDVSRHGHLGAVFVS